MTSAHVSWIGQLIAMARGNASRREALRLRSEVVRQYHRGRLAEAVEAARRLSAWQREHLGASNPGTIQGLENLALLLETKGEASEAAAVLREVESLRGLSPIAGPREPQASDREPEPESSVPNEFEPAPVPPGFCIEAEFALLAEALADLADRCAAAAEAIALDGSLPPVDLAPFMSACRQRFLQLHAMAPGRQAEASTDP